MQGLNATKSEEEGQGQGQGEEEVGEGGGERREEEDQEVQEQGGEKERVTARAVRSRVQVKGGYQNVYVFAERYGSGSGLESGLESGAGLESWSGSGSVPTGALWEELQAIDSRFEGSDC